MLTLFAIAQEDHVTLSYLKAHPKDWPKQVTLTEPVVVKIYVEGREAGSMTLPPATKVNLVSVGETALVVSNNGSTLNVTPEQTDLWTQVAALREIKASQPDPSKNAAAVTLQLPANSLNPEWYQGCLDQEINPWLTKYPDSSAVEQVKALKDAFETEQARVSAGDIRRGTQWYTGAQAKERAAEFEAEDLLAELQKATPGGDPSVLQPILARIARYERVELHPQLVRAGIAGIEAAQPGLEAPEMLKYRDFFKALKQVMVPAIADNEDRSLKLLKKATPMDILEAEPYIRQAEEIWPENHAADRLILDKTQKALGDVDKALDEDKLILAVRLNDSAARMMVYVRIVSPRKDSFQLILDAAAPLFVQAVEVNDAFKKRDYPHALGIDFSQAQPSLKKWYARLEKTIANQKIESTRGAQLAEDQFRGLKITASIETFQKARELWPENPEIISRDKKFKIVCAVAALPAIFIVVFIFNTVVSKFEDMRYKHVLKKKKTERV